MFPITLYSAATVFHSKLSFGLMFCFIGVDIHIYCCNNRTFEILSPALSVKFETSVTPPSRPHDNDMIALDIDDDVDFRRN